MEARSSSSRSRGPFRLLAWVVGALVALVLLAWGALVILLPPAKVRAIIQAQLSRTLARDVRFTDAGVGLFPPVRLTVQRPALSEAGGFRNGTAAQAGSIHLDLDVFALLGHRVLVRRLVLDEPGIHLVLRPDGTTNFDGLVKPAPPGAPAAPAPPMDFSVRELSIRHGRLLVDDLKAARRRTLVVDSRIALETEAQGRRFATSGTTTISGFAFGPLTAARIGDLNGALAALETRIEHRGKYDAERKRLALERLAVSLGKAEIAMSGVIDDPGPAARLDVKARGTGVDFGDVLGYLAAADAQVVHGVWGSGTMDFDLALRGALGAQAYKALTGTLTVKDGAFRYPNAPLGVESLNFTARFAPDSLAIGNLTARVGGQPVRARLAVTRFADPIASFTVQGNVDLAAVSPMVAPKDTKLGGRVALDVSGRGRAKDPASFAVDGSARLSHVSLESPQVPKKIEQVEGAIVFSQSRATVKGLRARAGESSWALDADVTRPLALMAKLGSTPPSQVSFDFRSPHLDLAELLPPASGPPLVPNAIGGGTVAISRLNNQKLDVQDLRARVDLEPGVVRSPAFSMKVYGGTVAGEARLNLLDPANPGVALKARVDSLSANELVSMWTPARDFLQGSLNTTLDFSIEGATPERMKQTLTAVGLAQVLRGQLGPGPVLAEIARLVRIPGIERLKFDQAQLPFRIEHGRIVSDPVVLRGGYGEWKVAGSVGFDGGLDYAVSATLPPSVTEALRARSALAAGALTDAQGNLLLDLRVSGPARAPRVAWDPAAMRDRVAGRVSQALEEQRAKLENELKASALARQQAAADSARKVAERLQQAVKDSLRRKAGDVLKGFFGGGARDTAKP
jgi:hypothetical protein